MKPPSCPLGHGAMEDKGNDGREAYFTCLLCSAEIWLPIRHPTTRTTDDHSLRHPPAEHPAQTRNP